MCNKVLFEKNRSRTDLPELSHFNILKLLQDKAYEHLKHGK